MMRALALSGILVAIIAGAATANATPICDGDGCGDGTYGRCCDDLCGCKAPLVCNFDLGTIGECVTPEELPKDTGPETEPADTGTPMDSATAVSDAATDSSDARARDDDAANAPVAASTSDGGCSCRTTHSSAPGNVGFFALALGFAAVARRKRPPM